MHSKKLLWHIFPAHMFVTIITLVIVIWYSSSALQQFYLTWMEEALEQRGYLIEEQVVGMLNAEKYAFLNSLCRRIGRKSHTRITVITPSGKVVADSHEDPSIMNNHLKRPEVKKALAGTTGASLRYSGTIGTNMLYVALPIELPSKDAAASVYVLRMSRSVSAIDQTLSSLKKNVAVFGLFAAMLAAVLAIIVSRRISRPLEEMKAGADELARGNFANQLKINDNVSLEVAALASAMNDMASQLQERIYTISQQRNELQTILASMTEGVIVVDNVKKVLNVNSAALQFLAIAEKKSTGRNIKEVIRDAKVDRFVSRVLESDETVDEEIDIIKDSSEFFLQCSGARLFDGYGKCFGAVITFSNVTRIKKLENVRREFVANVSHELMTPLTSIKGYAETILDCGADTPGQNKKFLQIIVKQANQLQAIVNDLLGLSMIEQEMEAEEIQLLPGDIKPVLSSALQVCSVRAAENDVQITLDCPDELMATIDAPLLEQAVVNLLVNAVKYSHKGGTVELLAKKQQQAFSARKSVCIEVRDYGVGIGQEHIPRLFERFYRSDKARSRQLGGTGLGLSIVKHIVIIHNGKIDIASEVGKGSTFSIYLPPMSK